jgi:hypothetical protein
MPDDLALTDEVDDTNDPTEPDDQEPDDEYLDEPDMEAA